ncbi:hypothetical protein [Psychrobacter pygoscelis]|uniref:hypothetical protein n=1 Tax=Psychrobacter pygoscelis TaxID=2488563 RepID=UPI00103F5A9B|nr:hypothetical protein [Psychrobacter pygoscelis]
MDIIPLHVAVKQRNQDEMAGLLGVTQGAVWQANVNKRNIFIVKDGEDYTAFEVKAVFRTKPDLEAVTRLISQPRLEET